MAITTCTVSGSLKGPDGAALSGVTVYAYTNAPFFHSDGTLIPDYQVTTTTDATGAWSLTLIETASVTKTIIIAFDLPTGSVEKKRKEYTVTVPATATASFSTLATGQ